MMFGRSRFLAKSVSRNISSVNTRRLASTKSLKETIQEIVPAKQEQLKKLKAEHGQTVVGQVTVENIIGGMRGIKAMLWDSSVLDPMEGIRFHGMSIPEAQKALPPAPGGKEMTAEGMFWLLLTGQVPTAEQTQQLSLELAERAELPKFVEELIDSLPNTLHPMTQLGMGVAALNHDSAFQSAYERGIKKTEYWTYAYEDCMNLVAKLPTIAARIYRNIYQPKKSIAAIDKSKDLVGNYVNQLGFGHNENFTEYLRLYIALHADHEGGNASAHTAHLVGSTLADPFISYAAGLYSLAGPLHGLANQEVLRWQISMLSEVGNNFSKDDIKKYLWATLNKGQVVPGYGHGVLRNPDPRFVALQAFCKGHEDLMASPMVKLVAETAEVAPDVLKEHGKTKNPFPNVDAASGCVLYHYGLTQFKYYTVIFGISRALGAATQLVWARALGLPIERPKSFSIDALEKLAKN
ncbi:citrate synthase [Coniophora puteana RWD-64-598 SS2]|uniref:Citrate synthase n=1 Tax=Coniophora puteana (strain RWD-64-598) TaxID=741705 RepID=A0A5M3N0U2_CONPW|nr:citrate synthase [Coniophora puteana RWD-64-598 SS2]EIW85009.1 citrate synthase [Coniophora puteana RWD-64-598 SS2]